MRTAWRVDGRSVLGMIVGAAGARGRARRLARQHRPHFLGAATARGRLQPGRPRHVPLVEPQLLSSAVRT